MQVSLGKPYENFIRSRIAAGDFESESQALEAAVSSMMSDAEPESNEYLAALRKAVAEGDADIRAGRVGPFDLRQMKAEQRRKLEGR